MIHKKMSHNLIFRATINQTTSHLKEKAIDKKIIKTELWRSTYTLEKTKKGDCI